MLSVKDQLVTKTAGDQGMSEELVDTVVMWVNRDAKDALKKYKSVEISGFGTFKVSPYRLMSRIEMMDRTVNLLEGTDGNPKKLQSALETKTYYETKL